MTILIVDLWSYFNSGNDRQTEPSDDWWSFLFVSLFVSLEAEMSLENSRGLPILCLFIQLRPAVKSLLLHSSSSIGLE